MLLTNKAGGDFDTTGRLTRIIKTTKYIATCASELFLLSRIYPYYCQILLLPVISTFFRVSNSSSTFPVPYATQERGSSTTYTDISVS